MNQALADSQNYKGYSLVVVEKRRSRVLVRTAIDYEATHINLSEIKYLDDGFQQPKGLIERIQQVFRNRL